MLCENCGTQNIGSFGSGRFCSKKCAKSFSTKFKRNEINQKVRKKLLGRTLSNLHRKSLVDSWKKRPQKEKKYNIDKIFVKRSNPVNNQDLKKVLICEGIKDNICEACKIGPLYNNLPLTLQIHHINGDNTDNRICNLQILCPNCHTQTDNHSGKKVKRRISSTE